MYIGSCSAINLVEIMEKMPMISSVIDTFPPIFWLPLDTFDKPTALEEGKWTRRWRRGGD